MTSDRKKIGVPHSLKNTELLSNKDDNVNENGTKLQTIL